MRILYTITKAENGGAGTVVVELLRAHIARGDTVGLVVGDVGPLVDTARSLGVKVYINQFLGNTFNPFSLIRASINLVRSARDFDPDIISAHSSFAGLITRLTLGWKYKIVFTAHGFGFSGGTPLWRQFVAISGEWLASFFTKKIICVSEYDKSRAVRFGIASANKIVVIHNGVSVPDLIEHSKNDIFTICFVARFARPKRQDILIEALSLIPQSYQIQAQFVSDGPSLVAMREHADKKEVSARCVFLGDVRHEEVLPIVAKSDVSVLMSDWEGLPMAILESLSLGVPVIASRVGGIPEIMDDSVGIMIAKDEHAPQVLSEAIMRFYDNRELLAVLGKNALSRKESYSAKRMTEQTFDVMDGLVS